MPLLLPLRSSREVWLLSRTISVSLLFTVGEFRWSLTGLISQVAEELWEVKDKKVMNLTKQEITIVDYKRSLAKRSEFNQLVH